MKTYKTIDVLVQTVLIIINIIGIAINNTNLINPLGFIVALGFIQIISIIIHLIAGPLAWKKKLLRKIHSIGTLVVFAMLIIAFAQDGSGDRGDKDDKYTMYGLATLMYAAIVALFVILYYTIISWIEWRNMPKE